MNKKWKILFFCHLKNDKKFKNIKKNIKLLKSKKKRKGLSIFVDLHDGDSWAT